MSNSETWYAFLNAYTRAPKGALSNTNRAVLGCLLSYANGPSKKPVLGNARPGVDRIAEDLEMGESTVRQALSDLRRSGWITPTSGARGGSHYATTYQLQVPAGIRALLDARAKGREARRSAESDDESATPPESWRPGVQEAGGEGSGNLDPTCSVPAHEPAQESYTRTAVAVRLDFREAYKKSADYFAIMGMIAAAAHWKSQGEMEHCWDAEEAVFTAIEESIGIPDIFRDSWTVSKYCTDPYEAGMKFWKYVAFAEDQGHPPQWDGTDHGLRNPFPNNPKIKAKA